MIEGQEMKIKEIEKEEIKSYPPTKHKQNQNIADSN